MALGSSGAAEGEGRSEERYSSTTSCCHRGHLGSGQGLFKTVALGLAHIVRVLSEGTGFPSVRESVYS